MVPPDAVHSAALPTTSGITRLFVNASSVSLGHETGPSLGTTVTLAQSGVPRVLARAQTRYSPGIAGAV